MKEKLKKLLFPLLGLSALIWFLIRVIPKPSRASYPCMKTAMPLASSFVLYVMGIASTMFVFKKARKFLIEAKYVLFTGTLVLGIAISFITSIQNTKKANATYTSTTFLKANDPVGEGKGLAPGRVVMVHNEDATNENCSNTTGDYWWDDSNNDEEVIGDMLSKSLQLYADKNSDAEAWDAIFKHFNSTKGKGEVGYEAGEKIVIKLNMNATGPWGPDGGVNNTPGLCLALLDHLVNIVGAAESDISIGDPNCAFQDVTLEKCTDAFPNVTYWGTEGDQTRVTPHDNAIVWSDGTEAYPLPQEYYDAEYMINVPVLKKHHRAGITLTAKNHFGSFATFVGGAWGAHHSLPCPDATGIAENGAYGSYRCFVDIMGHEQLGGKTILYLVDAIWGSTNWGHPPIKYRMAPFNNDWPSSIFVSQDPVATESVAFDFLFHEFDENHPTEGGTPGDDQGPFPHFEGTTDYMVQAADPSTWPSGIDYDPEGDGTPISGSLGAHEHWNNATSKQYSRNLGGDEGIELIVNSNGVTGIDEQRYSNENVFKLEQNYPNPFTESTRIKYNLLMSSKVNISIYDIGGKLVRNLINVDQAAGIHELNWNGSTTNGTPASAGTYVYTIEVAHNGQLFKESRTLILSK